MSGDPTESGERQAHTGPPSAASPPDVSIDAFLSYASHDAPLANSIVETLEKHGLRCWIAPRDVTPGSHYADHIMSAISRARVLVLVLSDSALASKHVGKEVERASSKGRPIIALRTDAAPLTPAFEYFLSESQWIDVGAGGVAAAAAKLVDAVRSHADSAVSAGPVAAPVAAGHLEAPRLTRWVLSAVAVVLAVAFGYLVVDKFWLSKHAVTAQPVAALTPATAPAAPPISEKSIAVLPFVDMSEKKDQEYFSDGLSEELIDHLAHNADLKVIARTSSFAFKGKNEDMRSIAKKLGVANLLEGSVRKAGSGLRITVQLIRASDGVHLWSETYDRKLNDIFKVQDEISTTVAKALNVALNTTNAVEAQAAANGTINIQAYNQLLNGNYLFWRGDKGDNDKAVEHFQQALKLEPHYALAWAKLARVYAWQGYSGELPPAEAKVKGLDAVQRALEIDPNCAEAYFARGNILRLIVGDWTRANSAYERAVALDPHGQVGDDARGNILLSKGYMSGRFGDYLDWAHQRLERNPLDTETIGDVAGVQQTVGHLDESAATYQKLLELNPAYATGWQQYGLALLLMGKNSEALAAVEKESDEASKLGALACVNWAIGRRAESDSALAALERGFADRNAYMIAAAHAYRGEADAGFAWLDRAYQQMKGSLEGLKTDPLFYKLRGDPRFSALLREAKLGE
jgi:TolB-like protein